MPRADQAALSEEALNQQFVPRIAVPEHERWLTEDLAASQRVRQGFAASGRALLDCRYGPGPLQTLDIFPANNSAAPILVWMHGGYWRALSKEYYTNIAPPLLASGAAVVFVGYDLCPAVSLDELLGQTRAALRWVHGHAREMRGDPDRIVLAGNSAGAHICAMALHHDWSNESFPRDCLRAAALITGIYDLTPVLRLPVQADIRLRAEEVDALSPHKLTIGSRARCLVAVGADEPPLWVDQSRDYHAKLVAAGAASELQIVPDRHHFSITRDLTDPESTLSRKVAELLQS